MQRIPRQHHHYRFDASLAPVLQVSAGERVVFETFDARAGRMEHPDQVEEAAPDMGAEFPRANPVTGPVYVDGAEAGMMLAVRIEAIELADRGWSVIKAESGMQHERFAASWARFFALTDGGFRFAGRRLPLRPMVGTIGTAPAGRPASTLPAGTHGGNMDNRRAAPGATIYLPVQVAGALLSVGDVHASMGDGEVSGAALEAAAEVTVTIDVVDDWSGPLRPFMDTGDLWVAAGHGQDLDEAVADAVTSLAEDLARRLELEFSEAIMLISLAGDVAACQCAGAGERATGAVGTTTARAEIDTFWR